MADSADLIYLIFDLIRLMGYEYKCIQVSGNFRFAFFLIYLGWPRCDADADEYE